MTQLGIRNLGSLGCTDCKSQDHHLYLLSAGGTSAKRNYLGRSTREPSGALEICYPDLGEWVTRGYTYIRFHLAVHSRCMHLTVSCILIIKSEKKWFLKSTL